MSVTEGCRVDILRVFELRSDYRINAGRRMENIMHTVPQVDRAIVSTEKRA